MNAQRKKIIITEINYWKQNRLLPEHYCDFLLTLYTQGEQESDVKTSEAILVKAKQKNRFNIIAFCLLTILAGAGLFMLNNHFALAFSLAALVAIGMLSAALFLKTPSKGLSSALYILSAFLLLVMSLKIWDVFFNGEAFILIGLLMLNCLLWLFAGRLLKMLHFTISGAAGLLLIAGFIFKMLV